jgi:oligoendopeptidase F
MTFFKTALLGAVLFGILGGSILIGAEDRATIDEKYTWNLADLYPSAQAWQEGKEAAEKQIPELAAFSGHLGDSGKALYTALDTIMTAEKNLSRLYVYASMSYDLDTRDSEAQKRLQSIQQVAAKFGASLAYLQPEILALGRERVGALTAEEPRLKPYAPFLDDILRMKEHTLNPAEEKIVAQAMGNMAGSAGSIYGVFTNADLPYPEVTLSDGRKVTLDAAGYSRYRAAENREDRVKVFQAFWSTYQNYRRTLGTSLYSKVKADVFQKDVRHYDSCLAASLDGPNIPTTVYTQLVKDVHANFGTLHRYLKLRQRIMGLDSLGYEDLYAPILKGMDQTYTPQQAMELVLKACAPLGPKYVETLKKGYESRWVDFYPSKGKRSGAYSTGAAYDVHPFQLLNFNGRYDDVSTLAHESGHSMHSYLSNKNQPYATSHYATFVAEVASTLNENLLFHYMLDHTKSDQARLWLMSQYLEGLRQTLFRQTLFAEFELKIHQMVEQGRPLTGDELNGIYLKLLKTYYGDEAGVCRIDKLYGAEWAYIPHFYRHFYVYQYATSIVASTSIAQAVRDGAAKGPGHSQARDAYIKMLSSGSSQYPIELLKEAGVDMTTSAPFDAAMAEMNRIMDRMEAILNN